MSTGVFFKAVGPIGDTDTNAIPAKEIGPSVGYYTQCLGFSLISKKAAPGFLREGSLRRLLLRVCF